LERRRKRAVQAVAGGQSRTTVAAVLGVHYKTVAKWVRASHHPGGLNARPQPGPTPALTDAHLRRLKALLAKGAKAHGWPNQLWTAARVARLIERHFRVAYHPEHVRKILKRRLGWTSQKPRRQARERNDKEVARWVGDEFPRIVREAWRRSAYLVFLDESGFMLTPTVRRTFAPRGKTPVLSAWDRRDRLSAISCVTLSPVAGRPVDLGKRAGQRRGWTTGRFDLYGETVTKRYKTFRATWRPAGGEIRVVLVDDPRGWRAYVCTDPAAGVADILGLVADRFSLERTPQT
jgi:transposase